MDEKEFVGAESHENDHVSEYQQYQYATADAKATDKTRRWLHSEEGSPGQLPTHLHGSGLYEIKAIPLSCFFNKIKPKFSKSQNPTTE